jgi:hypothetical protein
MRFDLLLDENFDLQIKDGDLVIGESTRQHQQSILILEKGENREFPSIGVGLNSWILDDYAQGDLVRAIKQNFEADGMNVLAVKFEKDCLVTEAVYPSSDT